MNSMYSSLSAFYCLDSHCIPCSYSGCVPVSVEVVCFERLFSSDSDFPALFLIVLIAALMYFFKLEVVKGELSETGACMVADRGSSPCDKKKTKKEELKPENRMLIS